MARCCSRTTTRRCPTTPPARSRCSSAGRFRSSRDITYAFNGGRSRYHAMQAKLDWRLHSAFSVQSSLTLSEGQGQRRRLARELERQRAVAAELLRPRSRLGTLRISPAVQQHDELRVERAVRPRPAIRHRCVDVARPARRGLAGGGHQQRVCRRASDLHLHADDGGAGVRASRRTSAAPTSTDRTSSGTRSCRRANGRIPTTSIATRW